MIKNVGTTDRVIRIVIGIALLVLFFVPSLGNWRWLGLIAVIPLVTAFAGFCPLYRVFGIRTCKAA